LFVSHNLPTLKAICKKGILLDKGVVIQEGSIENVINAYTYHRNENNRIIDSIRYSEGHARVNAIRFNGSDQNVILLQTRSIHMEVDITFNRKTTFELQVHLKKDDMILCSFARFVKGSTQVFEQATYKLEYDFDLPDLRSGKYKLDVYFTEPFVSLFARSENDIQLEFTNESHHMFLNSPPYSWWGSVLLNGDMKFELTESRRLVSGEGN